MTNPNFVPDVVLTDVRIINRNFSGKENDYNRAGNRVFEAVLEAPTALQMMEVGWNVRPYVPKYVRLDNGDMVESALLGMSDEELFHNFGSYKIKVKVAMDGTNPPEVYTVTSSKKFLNTADTIGQLDYADILKTDLVIHPYKWTKAGKSGISAYLKKMYVTIVDDPLGEIYNEIPTVQ